MGPVDVVTRFKRWARRPRAAASVSLVFVAGVMAGDVESVWWSFAIIAPAFVMAAAIDRWAGYQP
jgi:hypothetical protein